MRIVTWNVARLPQLVSDIKYKYGSLSSFLKQYGIDIFCIQEAKIALNNLTKELAIIEGYESFWSFSTLKPGYSGVTTYVREGLYSPIHADDKPFRDTDPELDGEGRVMVTDHGPFVVFNVYAPNAGDSSAGRPRLAYKLRFLRALRAKMLLAASGGYVWPVGGTSSSSGSSSSDVGVGDACGAGVDQDAIVQAPCVHKHVIVAGDLNIAHDGKQDVNPKMLAQDPAWHGYSEEEIAFLDSITTGTAAAAAAVAARNAATGASSSPPSLLPAEGQASDTEGGVVGARAAMGGTGVSFVDSWRALHPSKAYSFTVWDWRTEARARNEGVRIDYVITDAEFFERYVIGGASADADAGAAVGAGAKEASGGTGCGQPPAVMTLDDLAAMHAGTTTAGTSAGAAGPAAAASSSSSAAASEPARRQRSSICGYASILSTPTRWSDHAAVMLDFDPPPSSDPWPRPPAPLSSKKMKQFQRQGASLLHMFGAANSKSAAAAAAPAPAYDSQLQARAVASTSTAAGVPSTPAAVSDPPLVGVKRLREPQSHSAAAAGSAAVGDARTADFDVDAVQAAPGEAASGSLSSTTRTSAALARGGSSNVGTAAAENPKRTPSSGIAAFFKPPNANAHPSSTSAADAQTLSAVGAASTASLEREENPAAVATAKSVKRGKRSAVFG